MKFVCNAKLYSFLVDVLENAVPADVKIGNNEEFLCLCYPITLL